MLTVDPSSYFTVFVCRFAEYLEAAATRLGVCSVVFDFETGRQIQWLFFRYELLCVGSRNRAHFVLALESGHWGPEGVGNLCGGRPPGQWVKFKR